MNIWDMLRNGMMLGHEGECPHWSVPGYFWEGHVCVWGGDSLPETKPDSLKKSGKSFFSGSLI